MTSPRRDEAAPPDPEPAGCGPFGPAQFIQIPGPNPILVPGEEGAWDDGVIEAADAFEDLGTYYLCYHGTGQGKGYRLGVAAASHPLGPFHKHGDKPVLDLGPPGSWDDRHVACAMVLKGGHDRYLMWYSGLGTAEKHGKWSIGLATAPHPLGPWEKHKDNPILEDFGYVGGVMKVDGVYHLYAEHPIGATGPDYGPMSLAVADDPTGPWTRWPGNPVLKQGEPGEWDDGGFSEAEVLYFGGMFHMFYGGAKLFPQRILSRESIGYATSTDGRNFAKYGRNPVAAREANPNASAFAEVHAIAELPYIYLYHTLRYKQPWRPSHNNFPRVEDLGMRVLVTQRPFRIDMPVLSRPVMEAKTTTELDDCPPICLSHVARLALTVECACGDGLILHVRSSPDGLCYDTTDLCTLHHAPEPGATTRQTFELEPSVRFIKVLVENPHPTQSASGVSVTATLGG